MVKEKEQVNIFGNLKINKMEEKLVGFNVAKLAKEKEFDADMGWNDFYYDTLSENELLHGSSKYYPHGNMNGVETKEQARYTKWELQLIKAPTQRLLQKWLREKHGIYAYVDWARHQMIIYDMLNDDILFRKDIVLNSDEQATEFVEEVLIEALKLIKK
jgi:hypothetical protein